LVQDLPMIKQMEGAMLTTSFMEMDDQDA
jgi:hypothetical protein